VFRERKLLVNDLTLLKGKLAEFTASGGKLSWFEGNKEQVLERVGKTK